MPSFLTAEEATERLQVNRQTLYAYVSRGLVRAEPAPGTTKRSRYRAEDVEALLARKRRGRAPRRIAESALDWGEPVVPSAITLIADGRLFYRGLDVEILAERSRLEEVAELLWDTGTHPFDQSPAREAPVDGGPGLARMFALLAGSAASDAPSRRRDPAHLALDGARLLRRIAAALLGLAPSALPLHAQAGRAWRLDAAGTDLMRRALVLVADHELNASTFAVRCVAGTGASLSACLLAGLAALSGPRHGGMTARVAALFAEAEGKHPGEIVAERLRRGDALPGFGHPLYPEGDPRGRVLLAALPGNALPGNALAENALMAGLAAAGTAATGLAPNVDFALVSLARALGLPAEAAMTLFAMGRSVGWIAHALEQVAADRLIRPRARYVGVRPQPDVGPTREESAR